MPMFTLTSARAGIAAPAHSNSATRALRMTFSFGLEALKLRTPGGGSSSGNNCRNEKGPVARALPNWIPACAGMTCFAGMTLRLYGADLRRGGTLLALRDVELDGLSLFEGLEAAALDFAVVREEVLAAVFRRDETETLRIVEPLDSAFAHFHFLISIGPELTRLRKRVTKIKEGN